MEYIETPITPNRVGRTFTKMSKEAKTVEVSAPKVKAKYAKTRGEHFKDIVIAILVSAVIAFVAGMNFQGKQQDAINTAVKGAQTVATPEVKK